MRKIFITAAIILVIDQLSKWFVVLRLDLATRGEINVFPPYLTFRMAWNRGVNFGLFADFDMRWVLIGVACAIIVLVLYWMRRETRSMALVSAGLLVGGAVGNIIDRLAYGAVADFLNMSCCGIHNPYAFNVADIAILLGAVGIVIFAGDADDKRKGSRRKSRTGATPQPLAKRR